MFGKEGIIGGTEMRTPGMRADGRRLRGPVLVGLTIAGCIGVGDTSSARGVGARPGGVSTLEQTGRLKNALMPAETLA